MKFGVRFGLGWVNSGIGSISRSVVSDVESDMGTGHSCWVSGLGSVLPSIGRSFGEETMLSSQSDKEKP